MSNKKIGDEEDIRQVEGDTLSREHLGANPHESTNHDSFKALQLKRIAVL
jgi:hypothetical protein